MEFKFNIGDIVIDKLKNIPVKIVSQKISSDKQAVYKVFWIKNGNRYSQNYIRYEFDLKNFDPVGPLGGIIKFANEEIMNIKGLVKDKDAITKIGRTRLRNSGNDNNLKHKAKGKC